MNDEEKGKTDLHMSKYLDDGFHVLLSSISRRWKYEHVSLLLSKKKELQNRSEVEIKFRRNMGNVML